MDEKNFGFIISPALIRKDLRKGETISDSFQFTNAFYDDDSDEITFTAEVKFVYQEGADNIIYDDIPKDRSPYNMNSWISIPNETFSLKKGESTDIEYTITLPEDPVPGGKYAAIVLTRTDEVEAKGTGATLADSIAYQILGTVPGNIVKSADLISFTSNKQIFWLWPFEKVNFTLDFLNQGNVEYLPGGEVYLHTGDITKDIWNKKINPKESVILPENTRSYQLEWEANRDIINRDSQGVTLNLDYFRFGRYIATAKVGIEQQNVRIVSDRVLSFYIIPLPLIASILLLLLGIRIFNKRKNKSKQVAN